MLTPKQIEEAADTLIPIWDELKEWITLDLIERILFRLGGEDITLSSSEKWRLRVFEELGGLLNELHRRLLETTRISEQELRRVFIGYGEKSVEDDAAVFSDEENAPDSSDGRSHFLGKAFEGEDEQTPAGQKSTSQSRTGGENGIDDKPQEKPLDRMSDRMKDIMNDAYTRTNGELRNFTGTTADSVQTRFIEELDKAYLKVSSNAVSQWQAAQQAVDDLIKTQGYVTYPSGHVDTIEVAVIRAIRTGMARMSTALALEGAKEHGWNHVIVSSHIGARVGDGGENPGNHAWWQGKVYTIDGESEEFPNLEKATGYPSDPHGLSGYNCRHSARPFDPSRMKNNFPKYGEEENKEYYELTQRQREFERKIRRAKTEVAAYSRAIAESRDEQLAESFQAKLEDAKAKLAKLNDDYKAFCGENGFRVAYERIYVTRGNSFERGISGKARTANTNNTVDLKYISSENYHNKFKGITGDVKIDEQIYKQSKAMLIHRSKTDKEDMCLMDSRTGEIVGKQTHSKSDFGVDYNDSLNNAIKKSPRNTLISIHNHPTNNPPTGSDFVANGANGYKLGIVVTHNGKVYAYKAGNKAFSAESFGRRVDKYRSAEYNLNEQEAILKTLEDFVSDYGIEWSER